MTHVVVNTHTAQSRCRWLGWPVVHVSNVFLKILQTTTCAANTDLHHTMAHVQLAAAHKWKVMSYAWHTMDHFSDLGNVKEQTAEHR